MDLSALNRTLPQVANRKVSQASRIFRIESMDLTFSNGAKATYERIMGGRGAVMAVPFDGTHFYLTVEYAGGVMAYVLGLVKGKIDEGETSEQAVVRELEEEIGLGSRKVTLLKKEMTVAPGMLDLRMYPYLCEDLYPSQSKGDEPEPIDVVKLTPAEVRELIMDPDSVLTEGRTVAALVLALNKVGALS
ncbi:MULTISPECIES: ADP compounds hydrolase NudE [unclassified Anaerobiospirillum]|uniref:ADP compounds hydrolase NudE n=1 Tax=unclassified Anaerobiospirillum TaxID=2647410 RepID=UPI001FF41ACA|nr:MULTISPECIES: ADP compounds hydrolase NudE [unclassified Anaerobiospirillum]MCK0527570.1 ADP compounds hydrolase NudE [Anaerobiospirillum sp. NML120449]MCK0534162.1 ADP compounds hydrolase NudE [Anaerobiospirillum sp. NML120511]MCK0539294.1 ADP compounds hydrolase NudE [Anaerobiospirillum sp. NML02-A-032]